MGVGDRLHDRQPEPAATGARRLGAAAGEALEHPLAQVAGHARAAVRDLEHGGVALAAHRDRDRGPAGRVDQRVLHEVARQAVEVVGDPVDDDRLGEVEGHRMVGGERTGLLGGLARDRGEVDRGARRLAAGVGAGEQEQVSDQSPHPPRRAQRRIGHLALLACQLGLQQLQVGEDAGQRGAQLVRGVGDEGPLAIEGRLGLLPGGAQLAQHRLEGVGEVGHLVVGARLGQRDVRVARACHLAGRSGQAGDRPHRALGDVEAAQEGEQRAAEHAEGEEEAHAVDRPIDGRLRLGELNPAHGLGHRLPDRAERPRSRVARQHERARDDPVAGQVAEPLLAGLGQRQQTARVPDRAVRTEHANLCAAGGCAGQRGDVHLGAGGTAADVEPVDEVGSRGAQVVVEARPDALLGHGADHDREDAQDPERQRCRDHGQLEADGQARPHVSLST